MTELMRPEGAPLDAAPTHPAVLRPTGKAMGEQRSMLRKILSSTFKTMMVLGLIWGLAFNLSEVRGSSMMPGIRDRDRVLVDQLTYLVSEVDRGDIVVLR
jgi:signal peptidase I